ncbi:hypothetical protein Tco_0589045, partial [Tanacetum coccineum]
WQVHQGADRHGTAISTSSILCRNMLKFINSLLDYLTFEFDDSPSLESLKILKPRKPSKKPNSPTEEASVIECVLKFEREFTAELQSLNPILSSRAQAEPYLTHLAQLILGVGMDQQM